MGGAGGGVKTRARIAQLVVCWARCVCDAVLWVQPSSESLVEGIFSLGVNMGSDSIPLKLCTMRA